MPNTTDDLERSYARALITLMRAIGLNAAAETVADGRYTIHDVIVMCEAATTEITTLRARIQQLAPEEAFSAEDAATAALFPALPMLVNMAHTYEQRRGQYGPSEQRFADIMLSLFPTGLTLSTRSDWVRYGLFHQLISKLARYVKSWSDPHIDSVHDLGPYAAMLEAEDRRHLHRPPFK